MFKRVLSALALFLCMLSVGHAEVKIDLRPYYKNLDYFNLKNRKTLLKYEAMFTVFLKANLKKDLKDFSELDAKNILYGTLFLTNTNQGVRFKQISFEEIQSEASDLKHEMMAREKLILTNLRIAKQLLPNDYRIDSWIGTHEMYQEELTTGVVSDQAFNKMFDLAKEDVFSYTAMAVISNELALTPEQKGRMVELATMISDKKIPCVKNEQGRCFHRRIAPQTNEIGKLITGDIYLKDASRHLEGKMDPEGLRIQSGVSARVIYGLVKQQKNPNLKGLDWDNIYLKGRVKSVNRLLWKDKSVDKDYLESIEFKRAYTCYSCHAGAR